MVFWVALWLPTLLYVWLTAQFGDVDYRPYFAEIEPIFWKYEGRPHWGKVHTLDAKRLSALYPRHWQDFHEVREALDPQGRLLNAHLKQIFLS